MKTRVDAGTDVAMIGAWDEREAAQALPTLAYRQMNAMLESDSNQGKLFLIQMGGDCGGPIDVFIDEKVPSSPRKKLRRLKGEFLICVPSGRLVVGGAEDYRSAEPKITDATSVVEMPPGDYALRCYYIRDPENDGEELPPDAEMSALVGHDDYRYYRRLERLGLRGLLILLAFPVLAYFYGWIIALVATLLPLGAYSFLLQRWQKGDKRYQRIARLVEDIYRRALAKGTPLFAFELRRLSDRGTLTGGIIELEDALNATGDRR